MSISDRSFLHRAILNAGHDSVQRQPRWAHVRDLMMIGKTSAFELCERFGEDPDEWVCGAVECSTCGDDGPICEMANIECEDCY